ncbi:MAG: methylated-DNA--[protein]-cysteine S-methyltransferase [Vicinamibacteria bacterium]|nr:methylated-DNA--[protein]-cysteine S-methyltransferase [Vicinamibacteria bacterium]
MRMLYTYVDTPVGDLLVAGDEGALRLVSFPTGKMRRRPESEWVEDARPFKAARQQLREYFAGARQRFDLPLEPVGTPFQRHVWAELRRIPYGRTRTYAELAARIGRPRAMRAVGTANGANPLPIVVPCHRVIGADGSLTGFGGGLPAKRLLLDLEGALPRNDTHPERVAPKRK